jgi:hypothetical protein
MDELLLRLAILVRFLVPFLFMMAAFYLAAHIAFARLISAPQSQVLWFFSVITAPLTRPLRAVLSPDIPERRLRAIALVVYLVLWVVSDKLVKVVVPGGGG